MIGVAMLDEVELKTLATLADAAVRRRGFLRGRVRGWIPGPEVKDLVGVMSAGWQLPRLRRAGLVSSAEVNDPWRPRNPLVLWRITQAGENEVARLRGRSARAVTQRREDPHDQFDIYVPRRSWELLSFIQRFDEMIPWLTAQRETAEEYRRFEVGEFAALERRGFVERENRGRKGRPDTWVRSTDLGRAVRPADLKSGTWLVSVRLPEGLSLASLASEP